MKLTKEEQYELLSAIDERLNKIMSNVRVMTEIFKDKPEDLVYKSFYDEAIMELYKTNMLRAKIQQM
jgi:hypothetical protein